MTDKLNVLAIVKKMTTLSEEMKSLSTTMQEHSESVNCEDSENWMNYSKELSGAADIMSEWALSAKKEILCTYPDCQCPFDAPADPDWCAIGFKKVKF